MNWQTKIKNYVVNNSDSIKSYVENYGGTFVRSQHKDLLALAPGVPKSYLFKYIYGNLHDWLSTEQDATSPASEREKFEDIVSFDINKPKTFFRSKSSRVSEYKKRQQKYKAKNDKNALLFDDAYEEIPGNEIPASTAPEVKDNDDVIVFDVEKNLPVQEKSKSLRVLEYKKIQKKYKVKDENNSWLVENYDAIPEPEAVSPLVKLVKQKNSFIWKKTSN